MKQHILTFMAVLLLALMVMPQPALAQSPPPPKKNDGQCTSFAERKKEIFGSTATSTTAAEASSGMLSDIYIYIKEVIEGDGSTEGATQKLYNAFVGNAGYQKAVYASLTLMVIIFAVGFLIGVIQPSYGQVLIRMIKFGIIASLISAGGWSFFNNTVVTFFNQGTDDLVKGVIEIGIGDETPPPVTATPFYRFDKLAEFVVHPDTLVALTGSAFAGGPFGMGMAGLMMFAIAGFIGLLIKALRVYAVSYVARTLLLGLGPLFFVFLLFDRTKQLFSAWLNALISLSLQPILLFTFLSFFMVLIESATKDMLNTELCWTEYRSINGTTNKVAFWRFVDPETGEPIMSEQTWKGTFECVVSGKDNCPEFPMNVIDILTFLILIYLAQRFAGVVERIANELANTYIALDAGGRFEQFMSSKSSGGGDGLPGVNKSLVKPTTGGGNPVQGGANRLNPPNS